MKERYRLFLRRKSVYYAFDNTTKNFESLKTKDRDTAEQIVLAKNQALRQPTLNLQIAKAYLTGTDSGVATRTWQAALDVLVETKHGPTKERWLRAAKDKALNGLRNGNPWSYRLQPRWAGALVENCKAVHLANSSGPPQQRLRRRGAGGRKPE
jgi:hypothetical protein